MEIGCYQGRTTVFLSRYLDSIQSTKTYFAIDSFSGFTEEDKAFEYNHRAKEEKLYSRFNFDLNHFGVFLDALKLNDVRRVHPIKCDINKFDFSSLSALSFVLLDVDLYRPTKNALPEVYKHLSPGGIIVVDDCDPQVYQWDGAYQAFSEFVDSLDFDCPIVLKKLGIIRTQP